MLKGRLGLHTSRIPHADRAGLLYLARGQLVARDGTLAFLRGAEPDEVLPPGEYGIPVQGISMILLGPGSMVSHDALRLLARANTALAAVGEDGVRLYTAPPLGPDRSALARRQALLWADPKKRLDVARRMYAWRLVLDVSDLFRDSVTIPVAFAAARDAGHSSESIERLTRRLTGRALAERSVIPQMIDRLKQLFEVSEEESAVPPAPARAATRRRKAASGGEAGSPDAPPAPSSEEGPD